MVGPIRVDGLASGINSTSIIERILQAKQQPIDRLKAKITQATEKKNALLELNVSLLSLKGTADALARPSFFSSMKFTSSNESVLKASGTPAAGIGAYTFQVRRLAQAHQIVSNGFATSNATPVTTVASDLKIEVGGGYLERRTATSFLNAQTGFDRGSIRIQDSSGKVGVVDLSGAVTVQDVLDEINSSTGFSVRASVTGNRLTVLDTAAGAGSLVVSDVGPDATATALGIAGTGAVVGGQKIVLGTDINTVNEATRLSVLNDGLGVRRNSDGAIDFTITDAGGVNIDVDIQASDDTVQKIIDRINSAATGAGSGLTASLKGNRLVLDDVAGAGAVSVSQAATSFAAADLGLGVVSGAAFTSNVAETADGLEAGIDRRRLVGNELAPGLNSTLRTLLNGGQTNLSAGDAKGVPDGTLILTDRQGQSATIDISRRVFNAKDAGVTAAGATSLTLAAAPEGIAVGNRIRISTSAGLEYRTVTEISGNTVSFDQGLAGSVNGGAGVFGLNDSLEDILRLANNRSAAAGVEVRLSINPEGNGLRASDYSGGAGTLTVAGTSAAALGIAGASTSGILDGTDLDPQYLGESTALSSLNAGKGVAKGSFRVFDSNGNQFDVDLSQADDNTLGRVILEINSSALAGGSAVTARINDTGDGILLTDGSPGASVMRVEELSGGRTARDLNLAGEASSLTPTTLDGSFEHTVSISANANLDDVAAAINARSLGVTASVIFNGDPFNPYRLQISSSRSGQAGRITMDSQIPGLTFATSTAAQDAVVVSGSGGGAEPVVFSSATNTIAGVVPGVSLELLGTSGSPVSITVSRNTEAVVEQAQRLVEDYNDFLKKAREFTSFNPDTFQTGVLFSDAILRNIKRDLANYLIRPVSGIAEGDINRLSEVGIKVGAEGVATFDSSAFSSALESNFDQVQNLFVAQRKLTTSTKLSELNSGSGVREIQGADFKVISRDGVTTFDVDVNGATTLGSLIVGINTAPGNNGIIRAQISSDGFSLELVDASLISARSAGGATTATTFFATEADLTGLADSRIVGSTIKFTGGPNVGQSRKVTAFDPLTEEITLDSALPFAAYAGSAYTLERELEVQRVGESTTASELKILTKMSLGASTLKSAIIGLEGDPGAASRISERLDFITRGGDGLITGRTDSLDKTVEGYREDIERIEKRLAAAQENLVRRFAKLEQSIAQSQSLGQRLQAVMGSIMSSQGAGF